MNFGVHANYWEGGYSWLDKPHGQNIGVFEALKPHKVGAYAHKPKLHYFDLLWICCTTSCTTNPQQVEVMEFGLYVDKSGE